VRAKNRLTYIGEAAGQRRRLRRRQHALGSDSRSRSRRHNGHRHLRAAALTAFTAITGLVILVVALPLREEEMCINPPVKGVKGKEGRDCSSYCTEE